MLSKARLALFLLVLLILAGGTLALALALDMSTFWAKTLPVSVMTATAGVVMSLGLLNKAPKD